MMMADDDLEDIKRWQEWYELMLNEPDSRCPECGVQLMQMHLEGCAEYQRIKDSLVPVEVAS